MRRRENDQCNLYVRTSWKLNSRKIKAHQIKKVWYLAKSFIRIPISALLKEKSVAKGMDRVENIGRGTMAKPSF